MVIYDREKDSCELFEIKHSGEIVDNQYHALEDEEVQRLVEKKYGPITARTVLYRGEPKNLSNGIRYRNVVDYLKKETKRSRVW